MRGWRRIPTKAQLAAHMEMMRNSRDTTGLTAEDRLWRGTDRSGGANACWVWQRALIKGYGRIWTGGTPRYMYTHRLSWFLSGRKVTKKRPLVLHMTTHPASTPPTCTPAT